MHISPVAALDYPCSLPKNNKKTHSISGSNAVGAIIDRCGRRGTDFGFYFTKVKDERYLKNEVKNLAQFISILTFRQLQRGSTHSYVLCD